LSSGPDYPEILKWFVYFGRKADDFPESKKDFQGDAGTPDLHRSQGLGNGRSVYWNRRSAYLSDSGRKQQRGMKELVEEFLSDR